MDRIEKFLRKLEKKMTLQLMQVLTNIVLLKLAKYDVKKMHGHENLFRIRLGKIRIIFKKEDQEGVTIDINFRGEVYKNL